MFVTVYQNCKLKILNIAKIHNSQFEITKSNLKSKKI